jgi:DNA invertase Pin-like site-specific DNA recombinase
MEKSENVVLFCRVSTESQSYDRQVIELTDYCTKVGWNILEVFSNKISGIKSIDERVELQEMITFIQENDVKRVVCTEISRLGRNTLESLKVIQELTNKGVSLYIKNYNLSTLNEDGSINPVTSLITTILLEISQLERRLIVERVSSGRKVYIEKCRESGVKMGRPSGSTKVSDTYKEEYSKELNLLKKGISLRNVQSITGTSINTLRKIKKMFL